ncbi:murein biosynthesis integral membrane protein MurJ [Luteococcus sp. Sow4_B9]|uniref:murein biosynthesis integral membrane protein MurJ n=1 Tax=Luteococcus sp. Sow4_B9 TaxID=3438792 RepID=UPI003F9E8557
MTFDAVGRPRRGHWDVSFAGTEVADATQTVVIDTRAGDDDAASVAAPVRAVTETDDESEPGGTPAVRKQSLGRASAIMAMGSLVSRILGLGRQYLFAQVVAASAVATAFNVANTMPNYLLMVLNAGILNAVLIPQITRAMKDDDGGQVFVDKLLTAAFGAIALLTVAATAAVPWLIQWTNKQDGDALRLSIMFGFICMPQILFYGLYSVLGNVLNARDQFAAFMWAPALANVVQIGGLGYFLWRWGLQTNPSTWTPEMVWTLAGSTTLGIAVQAFILVPPLVKGGFRYRPRFGLRGSGLGEASRMVGWTFSALLVSLAGGLIVQIVLTSLPDQPGVGGFASYNFAMLIFTLPHGLITVSILTALFPQMSRSWQDGDVAGLRRLVNKALSTPAVAIIPASIAMIVLARPLVDVMLRLPAGQSEPVVLALQIMCLGILGYGISVLQQRYCYARGEGRDNFLYQGLLTLVQVLCAVLGVWLAPDRWVLPIVAMGVVVGNWGQSLLWMAVARRQLDGLGLHEVVRLWTRLLIASLLAGGTAWLAVYGMSGFGRSWLLSVLTCAVAGLCFGLVFLAAARLMRIREVDGMLAPVLRRLKLA